MSTTATTSVDFTFKVSVIYGQRVHLMPEGKDHRHGKFHICHSIQVGEKPEPRFTSKCGLLKDRYTVKCSAGVHEEDDMEARACKRCQ